MKKNILRLLPATFFLLLAASNLSALTIKERKISFNSGWKFLLGDDQSASSPSFNDAAWRSLDLPHDWSIELPFDKESPTGTGGGALRGGIGWYRKIFSLPSSSKGKNFFIDFDGVYMNSEVWITGHSLGVRPNGYISFRYDLTPYLKFGDEKNVIAVKADNAKQPNSGWYSGSGIYMNVWLVTTNDVLVDHWGTYITTPRLNDRSATVDIKINIRNTNATNKNVIVKTIIYDASDKQVATGYSTLNARQTAITETSQQTKITAPHLWSIDDPYEYTAKTEVVNNGKTTDEYTTRFGIRYFRFEVEKGFFLNGKAVKIIGVCDHHDLGCLGTAINTRATDLESFKAPQHKAFNGLCLGVIQSTTKTGTIRLTVSADGLLPATIFIQTK